MKRISFIISALFLLGTTVFVLGCKKNTSDLEFNPDRQFSPGDITIKAGEIEALLSWNASLFSPATTTYTIQISEDSTFAAAPLASFEVSKPTITITDSILSVRTPYYARVKANAVNASAESYWVYSSSFQISGEQLFYPVQDVDITHESVLLKWRTSAGLTKIVITPEGGTGTDYLLTAADIAANEKLIEGLSPQTLYVASLYRGTVGKGEVSFTTKEPSIYTTILKPGDDIVTAIDNAAAGDLIGLEPGTYDCKSISTGEYVSLRVEGKSITLQSVSNNPNDTKVNFREITLAGSGAGIALRGIGFDGLAAESNSLYFLNFVGLNSDSEAANFSKVEVDNCVVTNFGNCLVRANRGSANGHKIDTLRIANSITGSNRALNSYTYFTLDRLEFKYLDLRNSTFYNIGRAFISVGTNMSFPTTPTINIDQCTINGLGKEGRNRIITDLNTNAVIFKMQNSIIANAPLPGQTVGTDLFRGNSSPSAIVNNVNQFKLTTGGDTPTDLVWPAVVTTSNITTIDLGWTESTTDFTLPAGSPLRTASTTGGPIGDLRWAF